jgi:hypothetical protein
LTCTVHIGESPDRDSCIHHFEITVGTTMSPGEDLKLSCSAHLQRKTISRAESLWAIGVYFHGTWPADYPIRC